jgi:hypothetical protein
MIVINMFRSEPPAERAFVILLKESPLDLSF